ncbi:MAG: HlyD family secretion protein [Gammaproteobacteria bacterium]|jgi:multidrug resistance efflux pump|nr:HlyD family secretion protein [Gammaproteobacteria bacterium]MCW8942028.1 HlyD family secretion protein [Gammaproteobacteria bacterium]
MTEENKTLPEVNASDPVKKITRIALIIIAIMFVWYVIADRLAPWTDQARVQAYVVPIVSQVAGRVIEINVGKDQEVQQGDVLLKIDPADYQLAVDNAETNLELAGQDIGAGTANVSTAQAKVVEAVANLDHLKAQARRVIELEEKQIYSKARGDKARAAVVKAEAQLDSAKSELEKAKQALGVKGKENPKIRSAIAKLKKAQIDLSRTTILAPSHGGITNLKIDEGHYASVGAPLMTFIEVENVWVKANLRENSIANVAVGTPVDIILDSAPGRVFQGKVNSMGFAVSHEKGGAIGDLETIESSAGWLRDAQRFPVYISFDDDSVKGNLRLGGQADVQFYSTDNWLINSLGWIWIRVLSWFSYIY